MEGSGVSHLDGKGKEFNPDETAFGFYWAGEITFHGVKDE